MISRTRYEHEAEQGVKQDDNHRNPAGRREHGMGS